MSNVLMTRAQQFLERFAQDPKAAMSERLEKFDRAGELIKDAPTAFSKADITSKDFVGHRDQVRKNFHAVVDGVIVSLENVLPGKAPIEDSDRAENLVDELRFAKLAELEKANLLSAQLAESPWSDDYWATYLGNLGKRYADPKFPTSEDWEENYEYVRKHSLASIAKDNEPAAIELLSPAEKYDLLVGSTSGSLTEAMWSEGKWYHDHGGKVETWMGLCHGWAPASYMLGRPRKAVTVRSADGHVELRFYPSDIKALATLLWANAHTVSRFIGTRTNEKDPATDDNGRVTSAGAFDTNPGTWHLAVTNQIGVAKRGFVIDATYDYEVWNQPVAGYRYGYFNPKTMRAVNTLASATVPRSELARDRFAPYRAAATTQLTGIVMHVDYVVETEPSHTPTDDASNDQIQTVRYVYDIEQTDDGTILGGEWYTGKLHPDFLWTPPPKARAISPADSLATGAWNPADPIPQAWRKAAWRVADRGLPLAKIVEQLIALAAT